MIAEGKAETADSSCPSEAHGLGVLMNASVGLKGLYIAKLLSQDHEWSGKD